MSECKKDERDTRVWNGSPGRSSPRVNAGMVAVKILRYHAYIHGDYYDFITSHYRILTNSNIYAQL